MLPGNKTDLLGIFWEFVNVDFCSRWSADSNGHLSELLGGGGLKAKMSARGARGNMWNSAINQQINVKHVVKKRINGINLQILNMEF